MKADVVLGGFRSRRLPISADYRPMYKTGLIVMILGKVCVGDKGSLGKLHFLVWALKSERNRLFVEDILASSDTTHLFSWGVEPALNKGLMWSVAEGVVVLSNDKYSLTEKGKTLLKLIDGEKELFVDEKKFLTKIGKKQVTEAFINQLTNKIVK